ncbi:uncharacterized protein [Maniola hyperantus]|uniref:uncharacterized protein n=1 Tax=Aphantopus hyperantus TaxID=2795564 RepID=UPI0015694E23|nr:uncharacterized protein LOC117995141 [Maniola hyperantus]
MGSSKFLIIQNTTMAEGKKSIKNKLIKPFVALFRKNKKDKTNEIPTNTDATTNENATNRVATANENATNERSKEAPFDNLLKKLEKLEIDKKAREASTLFDKDSICDSDSEVDKELHEKFDKKPRNDSTQVHNIQDYKNDKELHKFDKKAINNVNYNNQDNDSVIDNDDAELLERFNELEIEKKEVSQVEEDEEELKKFSTKIVTDDARSLRIDSQSSEDSGFTEKCSLIESDEENHDKDVDRIEEKGGEEEEKKEGAKQKKLHKAYLRRGPIKNKRSQAPASAPYPCEINLNPQIYSGGQVIINSNQFLQPQQASTPSIFIEASTEHQYLQTNELPNEFDLSSYLSQEEINTCCSILQTELPQTQAIPNFVNSPPNQYNFNLNSTPPLIPEFDLNPPYDDISENVLKDLDPYVLTPPSSVHSHFMYSPQNRNIESPLKCIDTSPESDALSWNEELEQFRDISPNDQLFSPPLDAEIKDTTPAESPRLYKNLKQYKDRQKEMEKEFSRMECCQIIQKPCKEVFNEHLQKLQEGDRRKLCYSVANLELRSAFGVLMHTLVDLSSSDQPEELKMALFCLVSEKVLATQKTLFLEDFGLNLLQFAVLRCYKRPVITRYLVQCIRVVTRSVEYKCSNKIVFTEVDANGDNLLIACVREGDKCANVLRELVRVDDKDVPLFDVHHVNTDGYTALHVCCSEHSASAPRAHTLHVLLRHAGAERERQDRKGGETPLHLAVNSANCSLDMILIYFHNIERAQWYSLAHMKNSSGKNPLEYAKFGKKSRPNYPREILDFLERCRK